MISIIIPVFNKAPFLERCLDSLVNQVNKSAQVIIVDDGSTDGSAEMLDRYAKQYGFEVYHNQHKGVSAARNFGLRRTIGDYLTFLDADDAYTEDAVDVMARMTRHQLNIIQFGQYRHHAYKTYKDRVVKGNYPPQHLPKRWTMVWNKLYKKRFLDNLNIKFIEGMQFGEDEVFNAQAILANGGLYHAPQTLIHHHFDDKKSLCRGELNAKRLETLTDTLLKLADREPNRTRAEWYRAKAQQHWNSELYRKFGCRKKSNGKYDIVYFVKECEENEELQYSLRSVEENFHYRDVWFYGGKPNNLEPDHYVKVEQTEPSKWERVRNMLRQACQNPAISENFWLFNDDFFILKPFSENSKSTYNGELYKQIVRVEERHDQQITEWTRRLRHLVHTLEDANKSTLNYAVHKPMLINRKKALEVLNKFPDEPMFRALYGNYWGLGGTNEPDHKIQLLEYNMKKVDRWKTVSSDDKSFKEGDIGRYIKKKFNTPSRFEN